MTSIASKNNDKTKKGIKDGKEILSAILVVGGWGVILLSIVPYLLHWRVANEPGYSSDPKLLRAIYCFSSLGGLVFIGSQIYLLIKRAWIWFIVAWLLCFGELIIAISLSPILLLFLV